MKTLLKRKEPKKEGLRRVRSELLELYNSCLENAKDLIEEAELLFKYGHFPRAYALGFTAFEELGKSQIVADLFNDMVSESEFEAAFKDHKIKAAYCKRYVLVPEKYKGEWNIEYDRSSMADYVKLRMDSLYVMYGVGHKPIVPKDVIPKELAESVINACRKYLKDIIEMSYLTERIGTKAFTK